MYLNNVFFRYVKKKTYFFLTTTLRVGAGLENPSPPGTGLGVNFLSPTGLGAGMGTVKRGQGREC